MNFIKKLRDDRRGVAIEFAIMAMIFTFMLSILLTTVTLLQYRRKTATLYDVSEKYAIENIANSFCNAVCSGELADFECDDENYKCEIDQNSKSDITNYFLSITDKNDDKTVFVLELEECDGKIKILVWNTVRG